MSGNTDLPNDRNTVSVVMPCFNNSATVENSIRSALDQSYNNVEVILVDDGSTDESLEIAYALQTNDSRLRIIEQKNNGPGHARNQGIQESRGEFIAFLDADDYWDVNCLLQLHTALNESRADLAYCGWQNIGKDGKSGEPFIPPDYSGVNKVELLLGGCRWPIHAAMTRKTIIDAAGGFDERLTSCMDYDLWLRIAGTCEIVRVPEVLAYYVHHEGEQITKNRLRGAINHWQIQLDFTDKHPDLVKTISRKKLRELTYGELLRRAYVSYWERDLDVAHALFRLVMKGGYGEMRDWMYMVPALLPLAKYKNLIMRADRERTKKH